MVCYIAEVANDSADIFVMKQIGSCSFCPYVDTVFTKYSRGAMDRLAGIAHCLVGPPQHIRNIVRMDKV